MQDPGEAKMQVRPLEAGESERLAEIDVLESHERELLDHNRRLKHEVSAIKVAKELHEAQDVGNIKIVFGAKFEPANANEVLRLLEGWASAHTSAMLGTIEGRTCMHGEIPKVLESSKWRKGPSLSRATILRDTPVKGKRLGPLCEKI